jgi:hypothetical protein
MANLLQIIGTVVLSIDLLIFILLVILPIGFPTVLLIVVALILVVGIGLIMLGQSIAKKAN